VSAHEVLRAHGQPVATRPASKMQAAGKSMRLAACSAGVRTCWLRASGGENTVHLRVCTASPVAMLAATRSAQAAATASVGPCRKVSSATVTTPLFGWAASVCCRVSCRVRANSRGPQGSPWRTPVWDRMWASERGPQHRHAGGLAVRPRCKWEEAWRPAQMQLWDSRML
jgi:hypothetical protein